MRYRVIFYNRATDLVGGTIEVPQKDLEKVLVIAGIEAPEEPGELSLQQEQVSDIAALIGFKPDLAQFAYHLEPLG
jgi:hypothetical protein